MEFRDIRSRAIEVNLSRVLQSLAREQFFGSSFASQPAEALDLRPYAQLRSTCFVRVEVLWKADSFGLYIQRRGVGHAVKWLESLVAGRMSCQEWQTFKRCFRQSVAHMTINLVLSRTMRDDAPAIERNAMGHNLYPFPTFREGISVRHLEQVTNLCAATVRVPLFSTSDLAYASSEAGDYTDCNSRVFKVPRERVATPLLPIHPWQFEMSQELRRAVGTRLFPTGLHVTGIPLMSLRTFRLSESGFDIKLPINATITSARRLLYQMHCQNAVPISALIKKITEAGCLPASLDCQRDLASLSINDCELAPHVSALVREPLRTNGEELIPGVDLWYGPTRVTSILAGMKDAEVERFWRRYCVVAIEGCLRLLVNHGIAVEPHLQNVYVAFRDGLPTRLIIRDLDHAILERVDVEPALKELRLAIFPYTWEYMPSFENGIGRFVHALFHAHLGEAIVCIAQHTTLPRRLLCQVPLDVLDAQKDYLQTPRAMQRWRFIGSNLNKVRALLRMRLANTEEPMYV